MSNLTYLTKCKICIAQGINHPGFVAPAFEGLMVIGESGEEKISRIVNNLTKHIEKKHADEFTAAEALGDQVSTFALLCMFDLTDPTAIAARETQRMNFAAFTRRVTIPDENIENQVKGLGLADPKEAEKVTALMKQMRNILEERPMEQPAAIPPGPVLVTP